MDGVVLVACAVRSEVGRSGLDGGIRSRPEEPGHQSGTASIETLNPTKIDLSCFEN